MNPNIARKRRHKAAMARLGIDESDSPAINVGKNERLASMIGGSVIALMGFTRGSVTGLALGAIGAALVYRGYTGHCQLYDSLGHNTAAQ